MKTIVVATDFSSTALNAIDYAADMAIAIKGDIFLLHVCQIPVVYSEVPIVFSEVDIRHEAKKALIGLKQYLIQKTEGRVNIETEVRLGSFFSELETVCEHIQPYTVVMGSQGTTATERIMFGGHRVFAMKNLMWPIITVPPKASFSAIKKIGLACNLNRVVETVPLEELKTLVNDFNAELHILNIDKDGVFNPKTDYESVLLEQMMRALKPEYHFITNKNTNDAIMRFAEKNQIDLLIVLPRRNGLLKRLMNKNHMRQLVLHSHVPVMALHNEIF